VSTVTKRQQQAMMATFLVLFPSQMLSGVFYPLDNMPWVIRWVTYFNPLRYEVTLLRNVMLKGGDPGVFWTCMAALTALGAASVWYSFRRFSQTLN
ncbi:MAG: ABC transporter permease, partial [bacterium]